MPGNLTSKNTLIQYNNALRGSAWFTLTGLSEATNTSIYENNTQNPNFDYNTARTGTSVFRIEGGDLKINKSMLLGNWGRGVEVNGGNVIIDSSTIDFNSGRAVSSSNGASVPDNGNNITIINSTITRGNAPAIYLADNKTVLTGRHLTILDNPYGLAVNEQNLSTIRLDNSIIGRSAFRNCVDSSANPLTLNIGDSSRGNNLSNNSDCALVFGFTENADILNFLGPLQFNGGPTLTIELLAGNPAIDGGSGSPTYDGQPESPATDQRGEPRPAGGNYDVGAFEVQVLSPRANDDTASTDPNSSISVDVLANDTPGADPINTNSVTIVDQPTKGNLSDDGNGNFTYTPDPSQYNSTGTDTFTYYFLDDIGVQSNTATVTITVNPVVVNTPPVANDDTASGTKNTPIIINVPSNDTDSDGSLDLTSVTVLTQPSKGSVNINQTSGIITYIPTISAYPSSSSDTFTYTIRDNLGDTSNIATVTINITVLLPTANNDNANVNPNGTVSIDVLNNDTNATSICVGSVLGATNGNALISGNQIVYTPNNNYTGSDSFTYKACNADGESNSATVSIVVNNTPPQAVNDTTSLSAFDTALIDVSANDTDPQGNNTLDKSSISITVQPSNGTVSINTTSSSPDFGKITYTPNASGFLIPFSDSFSYTITDTGNPALTSNVANVTILYTPVGNNDTATTNQGVPVVINVLNNDLAADTVCDAGADIFTNPSKGTLVLSGDKKSFTYTPNNGAVGSDSFTYKTCNPNGSSNFATTNITINPNQPVANPDTITTPESTPVTIEVLSNDTDATNVCVGSISGVTNGTAVITTVSGIDRILFTPTQGYFGTTTFTYTACSTVAGTNPSSPATVTVNVTQVNPIAVNDTATTNQNEPISIPVLSNDSDPSGQTLTICSPLTSSSNGTITKTTVSGTERLIFTPTSGFSGSTSFTYTACDPAGNSSNIATVNITVIPNNAPVANADSVSTTGSNPIAINVPANDTDSDGSLDLTSVIVVSQPAKGVVSVNPSNGIITYTATTASFTTNGSDTFTHRIKDNDGDFSNITTVTINVTVNPIANPDNASTTIPNPIMINVSTNDTKVSADLDLSSVTIVTQPTKGTVSVNTTAGSPDLGKVTYTPTSSAFTASGTDSFTYFIKDLENHTSNTTTVNISVVLPGSNQKPVANSDSATGNKNNPIAVNVPANDTDGDGTLDLTSVTIVTQPTKGTVSVNPTTGVVTYTPTPSSYSASSTDTFTYRIKDNDGEFSNVATVTLNINLTLPVAVNDTANTDQDKAITVDVLSNDINALNICQNSVLTTTTNGTTSILNNRIIFTPKKDFSGTDSFTYKACNADGESNPATITITVRPKPAPQPVVVQNVDLKIYKNTPTDQIVLSRPVQIQADIRNPNNFTVEKIETIITIDTAKVEFVRDSARQGTIDGVKYSSILDVLGLEVIAATNTTLEFISDSQLKVTSFNVVAGETIPVVFNVTPKANIQNSITGKSDIINPVTNQSIAQAQAQTDLNPAVVPPVLVRTGGEILLVGLGLIIVIGVIAFGPRIAKRLKVNLKR